jgi:hypothetical protein
MPLVLWPCDILLGYATGLHVGTPQQPEHYSSLSTAALRNAVLHSVGTKSLTRGKVGWALSPEPSVVCSQHASSAGVSHNP